MTELNPWPEIDQEVKGKSFRMQITEWNECTGAMNGYYANECCYFADDADKMIAAYSSRLRKAIKALEKIHVFAPINGGDWANACAEVTLTAIGPIPSEDSK